MEVSSEEGHSITSPRSADMTDEIENAGHKTMNGRLWSFTDIYKIKRRQITEYPTMQTLLLAYQSLGVVYGDLGTSPLYVFPSISISNPGETDILGIMSLIFWTLTLIALLKYICIVLYADDHGEGGTFALYSFLSQHVNLQSKMTPHNARLGSDINLKYHSKESILQSKTKQFLEKSSKARLIITLLVFLGTSMVIGDGALTPAISVLSAVQGIQSRSSKIDTTDVVLLSVLLLLLLFLFQRFGTSKVSFSFSPIMVIWFFSTAGIGVYNIIKYYPGILKALSPHYIYYFFSDRHKKGWELLGEIALCITGAEAMFADLGHFNKRAIQIAFSTTVYPSLILAYGGEAAYLIKNPGNINTTFYSCIPNPLFWPMFVIATLAAIVASQSLISASFSIIRQAMALGCFPRVNMIHTSNKHEGQVYSPEINYFLMIACILIVIGFKGGVEISNAFGVAVIWVMLITTGLMAVVMLVIWDTNIILISIFTLTFIAIEGVYMTSLLHKLPQGGWVPFAISIFFLILICSWTYGRKKKYDYEANMRMSKDDLRELVSDGEINRVPGICFFYTDLVNGIPPIIRHYVHHVSSLREIMVIVTVRTLPIKSVLSEERFLVAKMGPKGVYRCLVQYGYMDEPNMEGEDYIASLIERLKEQAAAEGEEEEEELLETSKHNNNKGVVFVMGRIILRSNAKNGWLQKLVINGIYRFLQKNSTSTISTFRIPPGKTLQVGMLYEI